MSKHTPGPWRHEVDGPATNDMRHAVLSEHTGLWIAATYRSGTRATLMQATSSSLTEMSR